MNTAVSPNHEFSPPRRDKDPVTKSALTNTRRGAHACDRCKSKHKRCHLRWDQDTCSSCAKARVECKRSAPKLQIRFSKFAPKPPTTDTEEQLPKAASGPTLPRLGDESSGASGGDGHPRDAIKPDEIPIDPWLEAHSPQDPYLGRQVEQFEVLDDQSELPFNVHSASRSSRSEQVHAIPGLNYTSFRYDSSPGSIGHEVNTAVNRGQGYSTSIVDQRRDSHSKERCLWPLSEEEMQLVKYFFNFLVSWFDYCDPRMNFRSYIGSHISNDAAILYAVLAVSARHRELTMGIDGHQSHQYEQQCLKELIPSLNDTSKVLQDAVFASALLLRLLEEMTQRPDNQAMNTHHVSAPVLMQIKQKNTQSTEFSDIAMTVALRQEIFIANVTQRAIEPIAEYCNIDPSLTKAKDSVWAHRIVAHAAAVTAFAYNNSAKDPQEWDRLWSYAIEWDKRKPDSFQPMYTSLDPMEIIANSCNERPSQGVIPTQGVLPTICYTSDCAVAGQQYLQLCKILLLAHDPRKKGLGLGRAKRHEDSEDQIRQAVRIICGIGNSNSEYQPAWLTAGLAVAMCGELFIGARETPELLHILTQAELHLGWPCLKVSEKLRAFWNM